MMSMKKILVALMSMTLLFTTIPVSAAEDDGIQITCNKLTDQDEPYTSTDEDGNEITVYTFYIDNRDGRFKSYHGRDGYIHR